MGALFQLFLLVMVIGTYFAPTLVAADRKVPHIGSIIAINVLLGWTLIGWVVALAMALRTVPKPVETPPITPSAPAALAQPPSAPDATVTGIEKLADLRREGLLTDDEYASAKARLLERHSDV